MNIRSSLLLTSLLALTACGSSGDLIVVVTAEETIADGIEAGDGEENIVDGWNVQFDTFLIGLSDIAVETGGGTYSAFDYVPHVLDLTQVPSSGAQVRLFDGMHGTRYDLVSYALVVPTEDAIRDTLVSDADLAEMVAGGCSYLLRGRITPAAGAAAQSTPPGGAPRTVPATGIAFDLCVPAEVVFRNCQSDGVPGVAVPRGGTATLALSMHGDHILFPSFIEGDEAVKRRAQWLVNSDLNGDDVLTRAELESITGADLVTLFPADLDPGTPGNQGYSLTGAIGGPITTAYGFLVAQLRTQGHMDGEGECEPSLP